MSKTGQIKKVRAMNPAQGNRPAPLNNRPRGVIAAAVAIAGIGIGWWALDDHAKRGLSKAEIEALDRIPSGDGGDLGNGERVIVLASYLGPAGEFCRNYQTRRGTKARLSVACRDANGWTERFGIRVTERGELIEPATAVHDLDDFLTQHDLGEILSPEAEAAALGH